jgi:hypothetical protein
MWQWSAEKGDVLTGGERSWESGEATQVNISFLDVF